MPASLLFLASVCWLASSGLGCNTRPKSVSIGRIIIDAPRSLDGLQAEREALRAAIVERLQADGTVKYGRDSRETTHILQVILGPNVAPPDGPPTRPMEVRLKPTQPETPEFGVSAAPREAPDLLTTALAGFDDAWAALYKVRQLDVSADSLVIGALGDRDARLREYAIQLAGERRLKRAVEPLCKLLGSEVNDSLVFKAIGALVSIGDPRAVEPLIELSHQKDRVFVLQVVFAVGAIGGRTAKAYLVTLASGHPDDEVRRGAKDALEELQRRTAAAARP
jgi:hypothetical protein